MGVSMRNVSVVIGANYGDEGKGLTTDYLANQDSLVVRFNGGSQAGHTVKTPAGHRHVFQHFGSGTLQGAGTLLSPFFVVNPLTFRKEHRTLTKMGFYPKTFIDIRCPVTTYMDMMINQDIEEQRAGNRHGSCGIGFGETLHREAEELFKFQVSDLLDTNDAIRKLTQIRKFYVEFRKFQLGLRKLNDHIDSPEIMKRWLQDVQYMLDHSTVCEWEGTGENFKGDIVFEGAQGLALDMHHRHFPHVTRSNTGLFNVGVLTQVANIAEPVDVHYVTRTYVTRHGAGPLPHEISELNEFDGKPYSGVKDDTNVENAYQGKLRFAFLDKNEFVHSVLLDLRKAKTMNVHPKLVVTHADQLDNNAVRYIEDGKLISASLGEFLKSLSVPIEARKTFVSFGNSRNKIGI